MKGYLETYTRLDFAVQVGAALVSAPKNHHHQMLRCNQQTDLVLKKLDEVGQNLLFFFLGAIGETEQTYIISECPND